MEFNACTTCGAGNGRCGMMITTADHGKPECLNCHETRKTGNVVIRLDLDRTHGEIQKTMAILEAK